MRRMAGVFRHAHSLQGIVHPLADLRRGHAQVLRGEGHVLLHNVGNDLVIRVLEHHADTPPYLQQQRRVRRVHPLHPHLAAGGQQHCVHVLGQGGFAGAVVAQDGHKAPFFNLQVHLPQSGGLLLSSVLRRVGEGELFCFYHG